MAKPSFATIKAAVAAGYRPPKEWEYGGQAVVVKGRLLVRDPKEALSKTVWWERGFRPQQGAEPHCVRSRQLDRAGKVTYGVYRDDQVEAKRKTSPKPPRQIDELAAVWALNRRAKRARDLAGSHYKGEMHGFAAAVKQEKEDLYRLKGQSLHHLIGEGRLRVDGYHRFPGGNWAEVLRGGGYTFHRPCPVRDVDGGNPIEEIDAKPRGAKEPRLKDALHTVAVYLAGKRRVEVFEWPQRSKARATPGGRRGRPASRGGEEEDDFLDLDPDADDPDGSGDGES